MKHKKLERKIIKGISIRESINDLFEQECYRIGRPMSHIIEDLIIGWLKRLNEININEQKAS